MTDPVHAVPLPNRMGRGYKHPATGQTLIGVSTLMQWSIAKPGLRDWGERLVAEAGADLYLEGNRAEDESRQQLIDWLGSAPRRVTAKASQEGDWLHHWAYEWHLDPVLPLPVEGDRDGDWFQADLESVRQMAVHYRDLCRLWQITAHYQERTVVSAIHGIGGTFDLVGSSPFLDYGGLWMGDRKTTNGAKPREDVAFQLCAYTKCEDMIEEDGNLIPSPELDITTHGYVIKTKPHGASLHRIEFYNSRYRIDMGREVEAAVSHYRFAEHGSKLISSGLQHPDLTSEEVTTRLLLASNRTELEATWRWAVTEGLWDGDGHQELAASKTSQFERET